MSLPINTKSEENECQQLSINPNNNLAKFSTNDSKNASIFYGVSMTWDIFFIYLLQTDKVFAEAILKRVQSQDDDPDFSDFVIEDIIDNCIDNWLNFKKTNKAVESSCVCFLGDVLFNLQRIVTVNCEHDFEQYLKEYVHSDPSIPITIFPGLDIEYISQPPLYNQDKKDMVYIGKRAFVYKDGKLCNNLPDIMKQVGSQLDELATLLNADCNTGEDQSVRFL